MSVKQNTRLKMNLMIARCNWWIGVNKLSDFYLNVAHISWQQSWDIWATSQYRITVDGHACLKAMCFYWLWDGPLFISVVTDKTVSWDWGGCFIICTILAVATATTGIHIYFAFYWDIVMLSEANWSREICKNCRFFGRWKTSVGHFDSRLGHVNSSAPIRQGVAVSRSQSYNADLLLSITPLQFIAFLNKRSGAETSRRDCKAWPCNCLDHFHHKMAGLASHRCFKNIFCCKLLMKRGFYLKSGTDLHCDITHS